MMRKSLLIVLPVVVMVMTAFAVYWLARLRTPDWQGALDIYLAEAGEASAGTVQRPVVIGKVAATKPWLFHNGMGRAQMTGEWPWDAVQLPYPPDAVRCVLVAGPSTAAGSTEDAGSRGQLLFVAHHIDKLWRTGWVVHEGLPGTNDTRAVLAEIGCELDALLRRE